MKRSFLIVFIILIFLNQVSADSIVGKASIEINLPSRTLSLYKDGILFKEYPVCVGKKSTPTPQGEYKVIYKTVNPHWINKDVVVPPGPKNPLGVRWIGITKGIGIHGNNKPGSIGTYASSGCIRMYNRDVEEVYSLVPVNTPVVIKYDRIKVYDDKYSGEKVAVVYPNSYKKSTARDKELLEKLRELGITEELIKEAEDVLVKYVNKPVAISEGIGVFMNDSLITCKALVEQEQIYVNVETALEVLGLTPEMVELYDIKILDQEETKYINLTQTVEKLGGSMSYDKISGNAYISMKIVKINGAFAGLNYGDYDKLDFIAAEWVKKLDYEYSEDSVDLRIFKKAIAKFKRKNILSVNVDSITAALGGNKNSNPHYGIVDLKLPTFLRLDNEYFRIENIDGRSMISAEAAYGIHEKTGLVVETFFNNGENITDNIDLYTFLEDYDYKPNTFNTVIDIKVKENQVTDRI